MVANKRTQWKPEHKLKPQFLGLQFLVTRFKGADIYEWERLSLGERPSRTCTYAENFKTRIPALGKPINMAECRTSNS